VRAASQFDAFFLRWEYCSGSQKKFMENASFHGISLSLYTVLQDIPKHPVYLHTLIMALN